MRKQLRIKIKKAPDPAAARLSIALVSGYTVLSGTPILGCTIGEEVG
jgi:hypothetical protein